MNRFMNEIALNTFSVFDVSRGTSEKYEPERFYHGFVLGLMVNLADKYYITSNRERASADMMFALNQGIRMHRHMFWNLRFIILMKRNVSKIQLRKP